jgi:hypothetical protein
MKDKGLRMKKICNLQFVIKENATRIVFLQFQITNCKLQIIFILHPSSFILFFQDSEHLLMNFAIGAEQAGSVGGIW